ncbi:MAG TPA: hypothetical protein VGW34_08340 [Allosphingosinicella sp.]|nr:hypothetical protein [Allosphingosinicella sp.]
MIGVLFSLAATAAAPPPPPPLPSAPPTAIADLVRLDGKCSLSVLTSGDDGLSARFNGEVQEAVGRSEAPFCRRTAGNYLIYTNSNVVPTGRFQSFRYHLTAHDAREFIALYDSATYATLGEEKAVCESGVSSCAKRAVKRLLQTLEAR